MFNIFYIEYLTAPQNGHPKEPVYGSFVFLFIHEYMLRTVTEHG